MEPSLRLLVFGGKSIYEIPLLLEYGEGSGWLTGLQNIEALLWQQKCNAFITTCKSLWITNPGPVTSCGREITLSRFGRTKVAYAHCWGCDLHSMDYSSMNYAVGILGFNSLSVKEIFLDAFVRSFRATQMFVEFAITSRYITIEIQLSKDDEYNAGVAIGCVAYGSSLDAVTDFLQDDESFRMHGNMFTSTSGERGHGQVLLFNAMHQPELLWRHDILQIDTVVKETMASGVPMTEIG